MIRSIIFDRNDSHLDTLKDAINTYCPSLNLIATNYSAEEYFSQKDNNGFDLCFINPEIISSENYQKIKLLTQDKALICISNSYDHANLAGLWKSVGYLLKPFLIKDLVDVVYNAQEVVIKNRKLQEQKIIFDNLLNEKKKSTLIGIPTVEGYEIIHLNEIIRCEGLQKCTRIITVDKTNIVSSYNIGVFKKLLEEYDNFFICHRSHIINLLFVKKFRKAGFVILKDGSNIPFAKNKKQEFLHQINHI